MTNSAADTSDGHVDRASNRLMRSGDGQRISISMVNENLRESREGSNVRQGIAGCSPASVRGMRGGQQVALEIQKICERGGLSSDGESSSDDLSVLHVDNAIGLGRELVVMRDDHEGRAARLAQRAHQSEQSVPAVGIKVAGWFIGQDNIRLLHERASHCDSLLFPS